MELILIRHGLPEKVIREDGGAADPELSPNGHAQARKMAEYLKSEPIRHLFEPNAPSCADRGVAVGAARLANRTCGRGCYHDQQADHTSPLSN